METLDCRDMECPTPVVKARNFLVSNPGKPLTVLVSQKNQRDNVAAVGDRYERKVRKEDRDGHFAIIFD